MGSWVVLLALEVLRHVEWPSSSYVHQCFWNLCQYEIVNNGKMSATHRIVVSGTQTRLSGLNSKRERLAALDTSSKNSSNLGDYTVCDGRCTSSCYREYAKKICPFQTLPSLIFRSCAHARWCTHVLDFWAWFFVRQERYHAQRFWWWMFKQLGSRQDRLKHKNKLVLPGLRYALAVAQPLSASAVSCSLFGKAGR